MKKGLLLSVVVCLLLFSAEFALGALGDYVSEVRGDTLVIKDYADFEPYAAGSLREAIIADSVDVPAGRVYELKANGYYPLSSNLTTPASRAVVIVGADDTRLVKNANEDSAPPVICGFGSNSGGINFANDLTVKNCNIIQAASRAQLGWAFFGAAASNKTLRVENCLFEHTRWVMIQSNDADRTSVYINDCYFVNMSGQACRRNGGVYDNVGRNTNTMWVENSTHVMAQGMIYKFRNFQVGKIVFNHNTFVNMSGQVFETLGYQSDMVVVNNIFVNCNLQPYMTGLDYGETDADYLPMGIINVDTLPAGYTDMPRKVLVDRNVVYWDPKFADMVQTCKTNMVNQNDDWHDQMITMNTRTQAMFDDDEAYPYLVEGAWLRKCPTFTDSKDLLTVGVDSIKAFSVGTVDTLSGDVLMVWRKVYTNLDDYYVYSDWPIPVDLSYTDKDLLAAAYGRFPVGDLNWFPDKKAAWAAQREAEIAAIEELRNSGKIDIATNGGFEQTPAGSVTNLAKGIAGWVIEVAAGIDPAPAFEIVTDQVQEGDNALAITVNALGTNAWDIQVVAEDIPVKPGATYTYSIWAKASAAAKANFTVGNADFSEYMRVHEKALNTEWTEIRQDFTVSDQYTIIRAPIHVNIAGNEGVTIYIDNLTITEKPSAIAPKTTPEKFALRQNYPNPFNPTTNINFTLPEPGNVTLKVYNMLGQEVATLINNEHRGANATHSILFDGSKLSSGVYFYTLTYGDKTVSKKMVLMK